MSGRLLVAALLLLQVTYQGVQGYWYCDSSDVAGTWVLNSELDTADSYKYCYSRGSKTIQHRVSLYEPNWAVDEYGNYGHWTTIYGVALEVTIHGRKYYSFFDWSYNWRIRWWTINCRSLEPGTSRDVLTHNYACFDGYRTWRENETKPADDLEEVQYTDSNDTTSAQPPTYLNDPTPTNVPTFEHEKLFEIDHDLIKNINDNEMWKATSYHDIYKDMTHDDMVMMAGGNKTKRGKPPKPANRTSEQLKKTLEFPQNFDWRNRYGQNYVSPVRSQGRCGSCYAFATLAMYESRIRIMTKNSIAPILSPQDVVECSPYSYGCYGGWIFPEGKYAEEFGFVDEMCNIYSASWNRCNRDTTCKKYYSTDYQWVGGYFGASNDLEIQYSVYFDGPVVVGMGIYFDFFFYRGGIYYHSGPNWLFGYHAVTVVGWGADERSGTKYWIVKNSWGKQWGENGYFRIVRGINDCDIESYAFEAFPIL